MDLDEPFLKDVLSNANVHDKYLSYLTNHINLYQQVFTTPSVDAVYNYELFEALGDSAANNAIVYYFFNRFPQLHSPQGVKVLARLKIQYVSRECFSSIALELGFWNYIKVSTPTEQITGERKLSLLEDVFEAFIGVTKHILDKSFTIGVGDGIVYRIIETIMNRKKVSIEYEDLYDPKTRLKELFDLADIQDKYGVVKYQHQDGVTNVYFVKNGKEVFYGSGVGPTKIAREKDAAQKALNKLNAEGFIREKKIELFTDRLQF